MRYCNQKHISHIWLQTDSLLLKNVIDGSWSTPWGVTKYVKEIRRLVDMCNARVTHIFREGNKLADHLANYALDIDSMECNSFAQLDIIWRRIVK